MWQRLNHLNIEQQLNNPWIYTPVFTLHGLFIQLCKMVFIVEFLSYLGKFLCYEVKPSKQNVSRMQKDLYNICNYAHIKSLEGDTWVAQSVKPPTLAQVTISQFLSSSPTSGCLLSAQSLLQILSPSLSAPPPLTLSFSKININIFKNNK